uniref:USP domain-containing protein n=1 Tax=Aegilops tauschii subsp. strangulata TaxID=200361 RepID=A0A452Y8C0_AEGTS
MYLSLPLPSTVTRMMTVTVFSGTGDSLPMPYTVTVPKNGVCRDLCKALSDACCLKESETLLLGEVYDYRIYRYFSPLELLHIIKDGDQLVAYKLPAGHEKLLRIEILHRNVDRFTPEPQFNARKLIGSPLVTCIPNDSTRKADIYAAVSAVLAPFVRAKVHAPGFMSKKTRQEAVNLFSCLDAFLKDEPLGPDDMWYCPCCKEHRQASKKLDLWRLPEILVVHLKRFSYSRYMKNKLDTFVNFPIHDLDMTKYAKHTSGGDQPHIYELYAVINHYGGLGGGHYSAYAKLIEEDSWYHFDDSHVSTVNEEETRTSAAYLLFYRRVDGNSCAMADVVPVDTHMVDSLEA